MLWSVSYLPRTSSGQDRPRFIVLDVLDRPGTIKNYSYDKMKTNENL